MFRSERRGMPVAGRRIFFGLWFLLVGVLAAATFSAGAVYGTPWVVALWGAVAVALVAATVRYRLYRSVPSLLLHASFLLMLGGGLCTYLWGQSGVVRLYPGETLSAVQLPGGGLITLPATLRLEKFTTDYYPGAVVPRNYVSEFSVDGRREQVSVNHPLQFGACTLYQSSFTDDGASLIEINRDPVGRYLSFAGYACFAFGGLLCLLVRGGRYRRLLGRVGLVALLAGGGVVPVLAAAPAVDAMQVLYNGRTAPLTTPAREFFTKVSGTTDVGALSVEEALLSLREYPAEWARKEFILVENAGLRAALDMKGRRAAPADFFGPDGQYRLRELYLGADEPLREAILKVDERVELVLRLQQGDLVKSLPPGAPRLEQWQVRAEQIYYRVPFTRIFVIVALSLATLMVLLLALRRPLARWFCVSAVAVLLLWQLAGYVLQWVCAGRVPLENSAQTLVFITIVLLALTLLLADRLATVLFPLALLLAGFAGLVSYLSQQDPALTATLPVLSSPWLAIHVSLVMAAYALLLFACLLAAAGLCLRRDVRLVPVLLYPAVYLLGLGIMTGAVWASVAWGRYWAWDPKETWALITLMVYAVPLHRSATFLAYPRRLQLYVLLASSALLMTYFGVNYLGGLHAYQ